ncbi:coiled-coil domain-containing protein 42-like protein [Huso huso]|uniref:Coiled-coil domain-containing protein 42-like protein n=1 Tax=Huso huso TaxID=61971 RepID=A0ABR0Z906_HUSHU
METLTLSHIKTDTRYMLNLENRRKNIFVTQLEEPRDADEENINHIPVIKEAASRILETGVNTLQRTLVVRKEVEVDEVNKQLEAKRQEFSDRMKALEQRRAEFEQKQQASKVRAQKFDKFLRDNDAKRRRALKKCQLEVKENQQKEKEIQGLMQQLEKLLARKHSLQKRVSNNKIYEDYLLKIIDQLPENYLEYGADSLVMPIIKRHETLSITNESLIHRISSLSDELESSQHRLETLQQEHDTVNLMANGKLSELQMEWDRAKERSKQLEMKLNLNQGLVRNQSEKFGSLLMAITNLADQCYLRHYGPLEEINILTKLDMIKEFILEKADVQRKATCQTESTSAIASTTDLPGNKERGARLQRTKSKTHLRSCK